MKDYGSPLADPVLGGIMAASFSRDSRALADSRETKVMGTTAHITTVGSAPGLAVQLSDYLHELSGKWSRFLDDSEISQLNAHPEEFLKVSPETLRLIQVMIRGHAHTSRAFDPTLLPALIAEGYSHSLVTDKATSALPPSVAKRGNLAAIVVNETSVCLPVGTTLDSGGVGKGLAADLAVESALEHGALGVMVEVGGDIRVTGSSPRGDTWRLAIEDPRDPSRRLSVVELKDCGIATSTTMKRRFHAGGKATHHIINPKTLTSAESDTLQATVIAPNAADAEMFTKIAFVEGSSALMSACTKRGFFAGCLLTDGSWITTPRWPGSHD